MTASFNISNAVFAGDWHRLCDFDLRAMAGSGDWVTEMAAKAELWRRGRDYDSEQSLRLVDPRRAEENAKRHDRK